MPLKLLGIYLPNMKSVCTTIPLESRILRNNKSFLPCHRSHKKKSNKFKEIFPKVFHAIKKNKYLDVSQGVYIDFIDFKVQLYFVTNVYHLCKN